VQIMPLQLPHAPTPRRVAIDSNYCDNITLYCERKRKSKSVAGVKVEELKSCVVDVAASRKIARMIVTSSLSVSDQTFRISSAVHLYISTHKITLSTYILITTLLN
jgi:hypothetical protein